MNKFSDSITKLNSINRRMFILSAAKILIFGGIISRMFFLQVKQNDKYLTLSDKNRIREWKLAPVRGDFKDYFGNTIAGNFEAYELHIIPEEVEDFRYTIYRIKDLLNLSDNHFKKIVKLKSEIQPWETLVISNNLSWEDFSKINNHLYDLNGVKPVISISREYPYKEYYTHVLGYVSKANENDISSNEIIKEKFVPELKIGKIGLEKTFENKLIGSNSIERYEVNAFGRRINQLAFQKGDLDGRFVLQKARLASAGDSWIVAKLQDSSGKSGKNIGTTFDFRIRKWMRDKKFRVELGGSLLRWGDFARSVNSDAHVNLTVYGYSQITAYL